MPRFFEARDRCEEVANELEVAKTRIRKVDTNFETPSPVRPKLIIICESPSYCEVCHGYPTVSSTGKRIFKQLLKANMLSLPKGYSKTYIFHTHYHLFAEHGVYITNLVRYQADIDTKEDSKTKDKNVRKLWKITEEDIYEELKAINEKYPSVPVLIACGSAFESQVKSLINKLIGLKMNWYITRHPSRTKNIYFKHYNPGNWKSNSLPATGLMKSVRKWVEARNQSNE